MKRMIGMVGTLALAVGAFTSTSADDCPQREYGWTLAAGDSEFDRATDVAFDRTGNVYASGTFEGRVDLNRGRKTAKHQSKRNTVFGFLVSYTSSGLYRWSHEIGTADRFGFGIESVAYAEGGSVGYGGSYFGKTDFDFGNGKDVRRSSRNCSDGYISVLRADGKYRWTATLDGAGAVNVQALAADQAGSLVATGLFYETVDLDPGRGLDPHIARGIADAFIVKLDADGLFRWARSWGGPDSGTWGYGVTADAEGNAIVSGQFKGEVDFDPDSGEDLRASVGEWDGFITKFDPDGNRLWTATFGGEDYDGDDMKVAVDKEGNIYYTSYFNGFVDMDPTEGVDLRYGFFDMFVSSLAPDGSYRWTRTVGADAGEWGRDVTVSADDVVTVAGWFCSRVDFDPGEGVDERVAVGTRDVFVTRYTTSGEYLSTDVFGGTGQDIPYGVAVSENDDVAVCGQFLSPSVDFDPTTGEDIQSNHSDSADLFVTKLYCGPCESVERHSLTVKKDKIIAEVRALVPGGRVTVECTPTDPPGEPIETRVNINNDNTGKYKLKKLAKGEYACAITEVRDADGNVVCNEPAGKRVVNVK